METLMKEIEISIEKVVEFLSIEYKKMRADRANPFILDKIKIDYYGTLTPINQVATISVSEARVLLVSPWDISVLSLIEKTIIKANLGVTPQSNGKVIKIVFPPLSEERRHELIKEVSKMFEEAKISIRNIRHDAMNKFKNLKKDGKITQDEINRSEKKIKIIMDKYIAKLEKLKEEKSKQIISG